MAEQNFVKLPRILTIIYLLVSVGALLQIGGGHWDVTWHALQNPETFLTPPHSLVYLGVLLTLSMGILGLVLRIKQKISAAYVNSLLYALIGSGIQLFSGALDLWWHSIFGFDGLLSPPHLILVVGMLLNAIAGVKGLTKITRRKRGSPLLQAGSIISLTALWMSASGMVMLFTLPFSEGEYYDFNPNPFVGAAAAALAMPIISSMMIIISYRILLIQFPVTILTALYVFVNGTATIVAHHGIAPAMPYYMLVILPAVAVDFVLRSKLGEKIRLVLAGIIVAPFYYVLYFPLVPHAFREALGVPVDIQVTSINLFLATYQHVMISTLGPALFLGFLGSVFAIEITKRIEDGG